MRRVFNESFIPVLLVFAGIFTLVFYSNYVADIDANQITVIEIPSVSVDLNESDEFTVEEEKFTQVEKLRIVDPVYTDAYQLIKNKQWSAAQSKYLSLIKKHNTSQARAELGYIYYKQGKYKQADAQFIKALKIQPVYIATHFYRAKTQRKLENYALAEEQYLSYITYFPTHFSAYFNLSMLQFDQQKYAQAIESFSRASTLAPGASKSKTFYLMGRSYQKLGVEFYPQAKEFYQKAIRVLPGNIRPRMGLASLLPDNEQGRVEAEEIYLQVLDLKENHSPAYLQLAGIYSSQGRSREMMAAYEKAIEFNPSDLSARYNYGLILLDRKRWSEAADQFYAIVNINPQHEKAYFNLGRANYRLKFYTDAMSNYKTALDLKKGDYPEAAVNIGLIYSAQKNYTQAIKVYRQALAKNNPGRSKSGKSESGSDKESAKLHYNIGIVYYRENKTEKALQEFEKALKLRPDYAQVLYNMGLIHSRSDDYERAIKAYKKAIEIKPGYRSAQLNLAVILTRINKFTEAEKVYREVLEANPRYASAWINLGLVLMEQGLFSEAEEVLLQASELEADNDRVIGFLARSLARQEKYNQAKKYYRMALDINPKSKKFRIEYVDVLKQQGNYIMAVNEVEKAIKLNPDSKSLKNELNLINIKLKDNL